MLQMVFSKVNELRQKHIRPFIRSLIIDREGEKDNHQLTYYRLLEDNHQLEDNQQLGDNHQFEDNHPIEDKEKLTYLHYLKIYPA